MIRVHELHDLTGEQQHRLLTEMIKLAERGWFGDGLKKFNIEGRTKIHKDFSYYTTYWSYNRDQQHDIRDRQQTHITAILENSTVEDWVNHYLEWYTISSFKGLVYRESTGPLLPNTQPLHIEVESIQ